MSGKSRGVDYTKWDKMVNDMSDSEDEEGNFNNPEVTTFDKPQSVTFGGTAAAQAADGLNSDGSIQGKDGQIAVVTMFRRFSSGVTAVLFAPAASREYESACTVLR